MNNVGLDDEVLNKLKNGKESAFATLFDQYHRLLYSLAYRYLKSTDDAEDAVQHTFMKLWEQRASFDFQCGIRSLLFTILKNYILNEIRHKKIVIEKHYEMAQEMSEEQSTFFDSLAAADFKKHLYQIVNELPNQKREVCLLKIEKGLSNQEVADKMNISVSTVKSHYTQSLKKLRLLIGKISVLMSLCCSFINVN